MTTYELFDPLTPTDLRQLVTAQDEWTEPRELRLGRLAGGDRVRAVRTNQCRPPQAGEWYISGAIPAAYRATEPMISAYWIVNLVRARHVTDWVLTGQ